MGSGRKRKRSDTANPSTIIKKNKKLNEKGNGNLEDNGISLNEQCPLSLKVKLEKNTLPNGQLLYLKLNKNGVSMYAGSVKLQDVNGKRGAKLAFCLDKGYRYQGEVRNGHGLFQRTA